MTTANEACYCVNVNNHATLIRMAILTPASSKKTKVKVKAKKSPKLSPSPSVFRKLDERAPQRFGRAAEGLYPKVSRTRIAQETGKDASTITGYFAGRTRMPIDVAVTVARLIGEELGTLVAALERKRREYGKRVLGKLNKN